MKDVTTKLSPKKIILGIAIILAGVAGVVVYQNRITISDWFSALSYSPTPEVSSLMDSIGLTGSAQSILRATHPSLNTSEEFNNYCDSHSQEISILGCYTKGRIYIYDIDEAELSGIKESTLAHELLHAVWERLSESEKTRLSALITEVYNDEQYNSLLAEDLETYPESERIDELHSRIGTEIVELPEELEKHYAKYFNDQDAIVLYYNDYIAPFRELSEKIEDLSNRITTLDQEIEAKTATYYADAEALSTQIDEFNNCANTSNCFSSNAEFAARRNELVNRKAELDNAFNEVNQLITERNNLAAEYNDSILRGQTLESVINSNAKVEEIK